ncbi:hypothetical protein STEG23_009943 [Scotinomys teguina]
MAAAAAPCITRSSRGSGSGSGSLHHDITRIMRTSRAAARRHHVAAAHSSALHPPLLFMLGILSGNQLAYCDLLYIEKKGLGNSPGLRTASKWSCLRKNLKL